MIATALLIDALTKPTGDAELAFQAARMALAAGQVPVRCLIEPRLDKSVCDALKSELPKLTLARLHNYDIDWCVVDNEKARCADLYFKLASTDDRRFVVTLVTKADRVEKDSDISLIYILELGTESRD